TPRRLVIELGADGRAYRAHGDFHEDEFDQGWQLLRGVLEDAQQRLTRRQILQQWPPDYPRPNDVTLWRWLERAVQQGQVLQDGTGRKNSRFRYWLPGQEAKWRADPLYLPDLEPLGAAQETGFRIDPSKPWPGRRGTARQS